MEIRRDDLSGSAIRALLQEHLRHMYEISPPESVHALDLEGLRKRTASAYRRRGVARAVLRHIIDEANKRGYRRLSLETGSMKAFEPAQRLYESFGFACCAPFGDYVEDPNSAFMSISLDPR